MIVQIFKLAREVLAVCLRVEKKVDEVLRLHRANSGTPQFYNTLDSPTQVCPLCQRKVAYVPVDLCSGDQENPERVLVRRCNCIPQPTELPVGGEFL